MPKSEYKSSKKFLPYSLETLVQISFAINGPFFVMVYHFSCRGRPSFSLYCSADFESVRFCFYLWLPLPKSRNTALSFPFGEMEPPSLPTLHTAAYRAKYG